MRTPKQAIRWATSPKRGYGGLCLKFVREAYGLPAKYGSAIAQWNAAQYKHREHWSKAPDGAPLFFAPHGSPWGHVVIKNGSRGGTTDSKRNYTQNYPIQTWVNVGYRYLGWTEDLSGVRIPGLAKGGSAGSSSAVSSSNGKSSGKTQTLRISRAAIRQLQKVLGTKVDGVISQPKSSVIMALQAKARTSQDGYLSDPSELGKKVQRYLNGLKRPNGSRYFHLTVDGHVDGPKTTAALERYLLKLGGKFTNLHKA